MQQVGPRGPSIDVHIERYLAARREGAAEHAARVGRGPSELQRVQRCLNGRIDRQTTKTDHCCSTEAAADLRQETAWWILRMNGAVRSRIGAGISEDVTQATDESACRVVAPPFLCSDAHPAFPEPSPEFLRDVEGRFPLINSRRISASPKYAGQTGRRRFWRLLQTMPLLSGR